MKRIPVTLLLLVSTAFAQDRHMMKAAEALDRETCAEAAEQVKRRIEAYTRMKFRRHVPVTIQSKRSWENNKKRGGFGGRMAGSALAFYTPVANRVTVIPWTIGGYGNKSRPPPSRSKDEWLAKLEPILIHELTHAIHHQNFYVVLGGARQESLRKDGISEEDIDTVTVEFLSAEGYAELVAHRTAPARSRSQLLRIPRDSLSHPRHYMRHYRPNGKIAFRSLLSATGYQDGVDLLDKLTRDGGTRAVRAILYRPPPRELFFQPELLATVQLNDPPEPDSVLGFLSPFALGGGDVVLTVNPGPHRYFLNAKQGSMRSRARGCLLGFACEVGDDDGPHGAARYAFFVADPDKPGKWAAEQRATFMAIHPSGVSTAKRKVPRTKVTADVVTVKAEDGSVYVRADADGLVVLAHESKPTKSIEKRVLSALTYLELNRPQKSIYAKAMIEAAKRLRTED